MKTNRLFAIGVLASFAVGCVAAPFETIQEPWLQIERNTSDPYEGGPANDAASLDQALDDFQAQTPDDDSDATAVTRRTIPQIQGRSSGSGAGFTEPEFSDSVVNVTLPPQPLPTFINTVFGEILEVPFTLGPGVAERDEMVSLRSVSDMPADTFFSLVQVALRDYGLGVSYDEGLFSVIELSELRSEIPQFITSRAHSDVPSGLRPVVQFVTLSAIDAGDMQGILGQAFPERGTLNIRNDRRSNALVISGLADDVNAAMRIINEMDELRFAGTQVVTVTPRNWDATLLANTMSEILQLEGYMIGVGISQPRAITLLPLEFTNQLMIFARQRDHADYALALSMRLDAEAYSAETPTPHVYQVQHTSASTLTEIVGAVMGQRATSTESETQGEPSGQTSTRYENLTVDEQGNRIIFMGTRREFDQLLTLMNQLDTPVPEVLIEVTIAEVTLTDDTQLGLEAVFNSEIAPRFSASLTSDSSFTGVVETGQITLNAAASASNNQINVLSVPRIVTQSGSSGSVQVGTDVPIITSQSASSAQTDGNTDLLQTVEYRSTGIITSVTPTVFSNNRIDLEVSQEISAAEANENPDISSPIISTRSLTSKLSLQDGQTAVLGGLIENRFTRGNSGIPGVKDVPILGAAFRNDTYTATRTMVVILLTPFILDTRNDRQRVVDALVDTLNEGFNNQTARSGTLLPPSQPMQIRAFEPVDS